MAFHQFAEPAPLVLVDSEVESNRFGVRVGRLDIAFGIIPEVAQIAKVITNSDCDLVIIRLDSSAVTFPMDLSEALPDRELIMADTLMYYSSVGQTLRTDDAAMLVDVDPNSSQFKVCIETVFAGYKNHYVANRATRDVDMALVYREWVGRLNAGPTLMTVGVSGENDELDGCLVAQCEPLKINGKGLWEVVLAGVVPETRGAGLYGSLLRAFSERIRQLDSDWVISTQAWNIAAQRAWVRAGLRLEGSLMTLHVQRRLIGAGLE